VPNTNQLLTNYLFLTRSLAFSLALKISSNRRIQYINSALGGEQRWRSSVIEKFHAVFFQPLLNLGNMRAVTSFHGAKHMNSRKVRTHESSVGKEQLTSLASNVSGAEVNAFLYTTDTSI
jgi:hypothetical protein